MTQEQPQFESQEHAFQHMQANFAEQIDEKRDEVMEQFFAERRAEMAAAKQQLESAISEKALDMALEKNGVSSEKIKTDADAIAARIRQELIDGGGRSRMRSAESKKIEHAQYDGMQN